MEQTRFVADKSCSWFNYHHFCGIKTMNDELGLCSKGVEINSRSNQHTSQVVTLWIHMMLWSSLSQGGSTHRSLVHPSASNWCRGDHHHGNSKWECFYAADEDRKWGHSCPGNQPSYPRTNCVWELQYTIEAVTDTWLHSHHYHCTLNNCINPFIHIHITMHQA